MTDREHAKLLEDFANDTIFCRNGDITVSISPHSVSFYPGGKKEKGFRHEDAILLDQYIHGARAFLYFLERNKKYKISVVDKKKKKGNHA